MPPANSATELLRDAAGGTVPKTACPARPPCGAAGTAAPLPVLDGFFRALDRSDLRAALVALQQLTGYRFVGIFRMVAGRAEVEVLHDREHPLATQVDTCPAALLGCCYVRDDLGRLLRPASPTSCRPSDRDTAASAMPLLDPEGVLLGTLGLCDDAGKDVAPIDFELLLQAASALSQHLARRRGAGNGHPTEIRPSCR